MVLEFVSGVPQDLVFSIEEYQDRVEKVRRLMREVGIDVLFVHQQPSVNWLSGYENLSVFNHECVIVPLDSQKEVTFAVSSLEMARAYLSSWIDHRVGFVKGEEPACFAKLLREQGLDRGRIGVEKKVPRAAGLSVFVYEGMKELLPHAEFVDASGLVERAKAVKSPQEICYIREAAKLTNLGVQAAIEAGAQGRTDNDIAAAAYQAMIGGGSEYLAIGAIVCSGWRTGFRHSNHKRMRLHAGDPVFFELGGCYQRYSAPCMRTISIGEPPPEIERLADTALTALDAVIGAIKPGVTSDSVARVGQAALAKADPEIFGEGLDGLPAGWMWLMGREFGYSVGAGGPPTWNDASSAIGLDNPTVLQAGMVFHLPQVIIKIGRYGGGFSECVLVTDSGCEVLTGVERRLVVV